MASSVHVDTSDLKKAVKALRDIKLDMSDTRRIDGLAEAMHTTFMRIEKLLFATDGASGRYGRWPPNLHGKNPTLIASGELRDSLTTSGGPHIWRSYKKAFVFGSKLGRAKGMLAGGRAGTKRKLVYRPPIDLTDDDAAEMVGVINEFLTELGQARINEAGE